MVGLLCLFWGVLGTRRSDVSASDFDAVWGLIPFGFA